MLLSYVLNPSVMKLHQKIQAMTKKQESELEVGEMKMLRFALGVTRKGRIRNRYIRGLIKVERFSKKVREARLRWYGHVMRRDEWYVGRKVLTMELPGKRRRGRQNRRFMDVIKDDMKVVGAMEEEVHDREEWRKKIRCGDL